MVASKYNDAFFCLISHGWHLCSGSFIIDDERWLDDAVDAS